MTRRKTAAARFLFRSVPALCLGLALLAGVNSPAQARKKLLSRCLCTPDSFMNRWHAADAVFTGTVTDVKPMKDYLNKGSTEPPVEVTVKVDEPFKNADKDEDFIIDSSTPTYTCMGFNYQKGKRYLVYAYLRRQQTFEYWSAYNYPSGTYGSGGVCGGTKFYDAPQTAGEIAQIRADLVKHPPKGGIMGKVMDVKKNLEEEKQDEGE